MDGGGGHWTFPLRKAEAPCDLTPSSSWTHFPPDLLVLLPLVASHPPLLTPPYLPDKFLCPDWTASLSPRLLHTGQSMQLERPSSEFSCHALPVFSFWSPMTQSTRVPSQSPPPLCCPFTWLPSQLYVSHSSYPFLGPRAPLQSRTRASSPKALGGVSSNQTTLLFKGLPKAELWPFQRYFLGGEDDSPSLLKSRDSLTLSRGWAQGTLKSC